MSDTNNPDSLCRELLWHAGITGGVDDLAGMANALADMLARAAEAERQAILAAAKAVEVVGNYYLDPETGGERWMGNAEYTKRAVIDAIAARGKDAGDPAQPPRFVALGGVPLHSGYCQISR